MNKRQAKKKQLKYWRLADEPYTPNWKNGLPIFDDYVCPYCGFDVNDLDTYDIQRLGGTYHYSYTSWTEHITCPICKTNYKILDCCNC